MSNIADKISKLIAKAESTTHPEEQDTFMAKVHQLLEQHGMSLLDIGKLQSDDPVGRSKISSAYYASESSFRDVAFAAARYYGCKATVTNIGNHRMVAVYGRESARITFELMWPYIKKSIRRHARRLVAEEGSTFARQQRYVADALTGRLNLLYWKNQPKGHEGKGVNALVPVDLIDEIMPDCKTVRSRDLLVTQGAEDAANSINLSAQVDAAKQGGVKKISK